MRKILKVREDFYKKDIKEGEEIPTFGGFYKILNTKFKNEFGTFILCEYIEKKPDPNFDDKWTKTQGVSANPNNNFEIIGSIHIPDYRNMLGGIGFFVKNHELDEVLGFSYEQTWKLLFHEGAKNAEASSNHFNRFRTKLIDTIDGLPSLDSFYWEIPAYNAEGIAFAPLTKEVLLNIEKGIQHAVENRVRERANQNNCNLSENTIFATETISDLINKANKIVILAGAGISTNSGIPDYRSSAQSLWRKNPEMLEKLNQKAFEEESKEFWNAFYQLIEGTLSSLIPFPTHEAVLSTIKAIKPNDGHRFFAWLQNNLRKDVTIVAQNLDSLDKVAGSKNVIEMHGNIHECICPQCYANYPLVQVLKKHHVPKCKCGSILRPNLVFFGDPVRQYDKAIKAIEDADLIIVVGTSMQVYPFNQLVHAKNEQANLVLINHSPLDNSLEFHHAAYGDISIICRNLKGILKLKNNK